MTNEKKMAIAGLIIYSQLATESNDLVKDIKGLYRHRLKHLSNELEKELTPVLKIYDENYKDFESFLLTTQESIEAILPFLRTLRIDEVATLPHFIEAYKKDREKVELFLSETLNKELI